MFSEQAELSQTFRLVDQLVLSIKTTTTSTSTSHKWDFLIYFKSVKTHTHGSFHQFGSEPASEMR